MDRSVKRLCSICARGGSKGVKNKNLRILGNLPLIAHSIEQAKASKLFDYIVVSSDSDDILEIAQKHGVDFAIKRPDDLATDLAAKIPAIEHCVKQAEELSGHKFDTLVDLDATSPLRLVEDIVGAVDLLENSQVSSVITAAPARRSPYFNLVELNQEGFVRLSKPRDARVVRRQDSPLCFDMNASIYVWDRNIFLSQPQTFYEDTKLFEMPEDRSVDIDCELDFDIVQMIMEKRITSNVTLKGEDIDF